MTNYEFNNYSKLSKIGNNGRKWFNWCLYIDENQDVINQIDFVKYFLHPTFPNPERIVSTKENKFALFSGGWGTFTIKIEVILTDGKVIKSEYYLNLSEEDWPTTEITNFQLDQTTKKIYRIIENSKFDWRKYETILKRSNMSEEFVKNSIEKLNELNLIRKAPFNSFDNQILFGITKRVGNEPK